jgi:cyclic-di-GMP-binding protein
MPERLPRSRASGPDWKGRWAGGVGRVILGFETILLQWTCRSAPPWNWPLPGVSDYLPTMANFSFDVSTGVDLQEVDNAVNQATKEVAQRYDFKGTKCTIELDRQEALLRLDADDEYRLTALVDILRGRLAKRGVPLKNLDVGDVDHGTLGRARQVIRLKQGIPSDTAKKIVKEVKAQKLKKVQVAIQGDELRVTAPSKDDLQAVMAFLRGEDFGVELTFGNYR